MVGQNILKTNLQRMGLLLIAALLLLTSITVFAPMKASAATCSGSSCNGKNPSTTGCTANAYVAKRLQVRRASDNVAVSGAYLDVYYSRTCGTNWVRFNKNPYCGKAVKAIDVAASSGYSERETDSGCGASYSMQVYAPGSTPIQVWGQLFDTSGRIKAYVPETIIY